MNFQNELRLHHWGTQSYAAHKALGNAYESLDALLDTFTESYMGVYGKDDINNVTELKFLGPNKISSMSLISSLEAYLIDELPKQIDPKQTALLNIRDEMLALAQQTKYLLTLS